MKNTNKKLSAGPLDDYEILEAEFIKTAKNKNKNQVCKLKYELFLEKFLQHFGEKKINKKNENGEIKKNDNIPKNVIEDKNTETYDVTDSDVAHWESEAQKNTVTDIIDKKKKLIDV